MPSMPCMPKFGLPGLEPGRWSPGRGRFGSKEKLKADPNHTRPNLPTALAQHTSPSASAPSIPRPSSPSSEAASSSRHHSKPNRRTSQSGTDVPAYQPALGMQHLLSAREMASHPNNVPAEVVLYLLGATNVPRNESLNISSLSTYVVAWVSAQRGRPTLNPKP